MKTTTKNKLIREIFNKIYLECINKKYFFKKPFLQIITLPLDQTNRNGCYCFEGYKYSNFQPVIKINRNRPLDKITLTLKHEFCHMINHICYGWDRQPSHNKQLFILCKGFELPLSHYHLHNQIAKQIYSQR